MVSIVRLFEIDLLNTEFGPNMSDENMIHNSVTNPSMAITIMIGLSETNFIALFSLIFLVVVYFAALVVLLGQRLLTVLAAHFAFIDPDSLWTALRYPILFLLVFLMLWGLYRVTAPPEERTGLALGALAATAAIELLSATFSAFIGMSARYALVYGSLTSLVMLMLWLYFCCTLVILGNAFSLCLQRRGRY